MELTIIYSFLLHLFGDYIVQNDWMATNKKKPTLIGEIACQIHCITYSLPFLFILGWTAVFFIYLTHYIIDRFHLVDWVLAIKNGTFNTENFGFPKDRPIYLTLWLYIFTDNIFHLFCNTIIIYLTYEKFFS